MQDHELGLEWVWTLRRVTIEDHHGASPMSEAKRIQQRGQISLKLLAEEGLRLALGKHPIAISTASTC